MYESGLTPRKLTFREDAEVLNYGMGVTNIVPRTTRAADELSKSVQFDYYIYNHSSLLVPRFIPSISMQR